jgi:hypothetical protein
MLVIRNYNEQLMDLFDAMLENESACSQRNSCIIFARVG